MVVMVAISVAIRRMVAIRRLVAIRRNNCTMQIFVINISKEINTWFEKVLSKKYA
jgi:hypothetical protein